MNLRMLTLIAIAVWTPIVTDADAGSKVRPGNTATPALQRCLSQQQILTELRKNGYRAEQKDMNRNGGAYIVTTVKHRARVVVKVDRCSGRILSVQAARDVARRRPIAEALRKRPRRTLKCLSKQVIFEKLKNRGYNYLKLEEITGPFNTSKGKVYRVQTLVKAGSWCLVKASVNCYNADLVEYNTIKESCKY